MKFFLLLCFILLINDTKSQSKSFWIKGSVKNINKGMIFIFPAVKDGKYYIDYNEIDSIKITNGVFQFKNSKKYIGTFAYRMSIKSKEKNGITDIIFLKSKNNIIYIDTIDEHKAPLIKNSKSQLELRNHYNLFFYYILEKRKENDELEEIVYQKYTSIIPNQETVNIEKRNKELMNLSDSLFFSYAKKHTNSLVTLWKLIERFQNLGYNDNFDIIIKNFSNKIKKSLPGKQIILEISQAKLLKTGNAFPYLFLKNIDDIAFNLNKEFIKSKYTLIDFWFLSCRPCRNQFPYFKKLLNENNKSYFQIIGINTDGMINLELKNLIKSDSLNWTHCIDKGAFYTKKLGINSFPTNYLINSSGIILKKNITNSELKTFLEKEVF